jgi:AcrR family transcriptional regulator
MRIRWRGNVPAHTATRRGGEQKGRILDFARDLFFRYGFTRVTIEEIVAELHISKTTFYKFFTSKEDLLVSVLRDYYRTIRDGIADITDHIAGEYFEDLRRIVLFIGSGMEKMDFRIRQDIRTSAPEIWRTLQELQHSMVQSGLEKAFVAGMRAGIVRTDMDAKSVAKVFIMTMENAMGNEGMRGVSPSGQESLQVFLKILLEGVFTESGRKRSSRASRRQIPALEGAE